MTTIRENSLATARDGDSTYSLGQRHDRIPVESGARSSSVVLGSMSDSRQDEEPEDISAGQKMLSAVSGSLLTSLLVTPLDVVRVRLQSQPTAFNPVSSRLSSLPSHIPTPFTNVPPNLGVTACCREVFWINNNAQYCIAASPTAPSLSNLTHTTTASLEDCAAEETRRKNFNSTFDGLRKIARNEGLTSLWRGLSPTLVMAIPANVIYFTGYDFLRTSKRSPIRKNISDAYAPLIAGSVARVAAAAVISPIEMFRTRMQAASGSNVFRETLLGLREMVKAQGYTSLWRGLTLTMWRDVPFSGIYWWGYEATRNALTDMRDRGRGKVLDPNRRSTRLRSRSRSQENHSATFIDSFVAGASSGAFASIITTPFDVGKTRQQVLKHAEDIAGGGAKRAMGEVLRPEDRSMPRFLYHIFQTEGVQGLFKGWAARCLKVAPACAIMISSYEIGKKMARGRNKLREKE